MPYSRGGLFTTVPHREIWTKLCPRLLLSQRLHSPHSYTSWLFARCFIWSTLRDFTNQLLGALCNPVDGKCKCKPGYHHYHEHNHGFHPADQHDHFDHWHHHHDFVHPGYAGARCEDLCPEGYFGQDCYQVLYILSIWKSTLALKAETHIKEHHHRKETPLNHVWGSTISHFL